MKGVKGFGMGRFGTKPGREFCRRGGRRVPAAGLAAGIGIMLAAGMLSAGCGRAGEEPAAAEAVEQDEGDGKGLRTGERPVKGGSYEDGPEREEPEETVPTEWEWKDAKIREEVFRALGYGEEEGETPSAEEIKSLEWLRIENAQDAATFRDLAYLQELTVLELSYRTGEAADIDLDKTMAPNLEELNIDGTDLDGNELLGRLPEFPALRKLYLTRCKLEDISFLEELPQLTHLSFFSNEIEDISSIASCGELVELSLAFNGIHDISALAGLSKLEEAGLHGNQIDTIEPLRGLHRLTGINVTDNQIADLSPLAGKVKLEALGAGYNRITDITPLKGMTRLYNLALDYNEIEDISVLEDMKEMVWLGLSNNRIRDFTPIMGMEKLFFLSIFYNESRDRDIGGLAMSVPELCLGTADTEYKAEELAGAQKWLDYFYPEEGITAEDVVWGDLNGDGLEDMAVTGSSASDGEETESDDFQEYNDRRYIYVLLGNGEDSYLPQQPIETLSADAGGVYGDPYQGISISGGQLVVETYGGSNWRWGYRNIYGCEGGRMEQKMQMGLQHYVYLDGYDWQVEDYETEEWKKYVIAGTLEGKMEKCLILESIEEADQASLTEKQEETLRQMEREKGIDLPEIDFYACVPELQMTGQEFGYIIHGVLSATEKKASWALKKAAEELLADAAALPVTAYTSEEIKANYEALAGVELPEEFYIGWAEGEPVILSYIGLFADQDGKYVHVIAWQEPDDESGVWVETKYVFYEEGTDRLITE